MSFKRKCTRCERQWNADVDYCPEDGSQLGPAVLDRYELIRSVAKSGMSEVFEAKHVHTGRRVALKLLERTLVDNDDMVQRMRREGQATSAIGDPNIVAVTDFGTSEDGGLYLVMEWIAGSTLRDVLDTGQVPPMIALDIGAQVAQGLASAHLIGIIHRDIKPENIMIFSDTDNALRVKILDFGVAKLALPGEVRLTQTGTIVGTPAYLSPEQAQGMPVDEGADIYSLGCVLYELFTGTQVFSGGSSMELVLMHASDEPEAPSRRSPERNIPPAVEATIMRCLAKSRELRFPSMTALKDKLRSLQHEAVPQLETAELTAANTSIFESREVAQLAGPPRAARASTQVPPLPQSAEFSAPGPSHWKHTAFLFAAIAVVATLTVALLLTREDSPSKEATPAVAAAQETQTSASLVVEGPNEAIDAETNPGSAKADDAETDPGSVKAEEEAKTVWRHERKHAKFSIMLNASPRPLLPKEPIELEFQLSKFTGKLSWAVTERKLRADLQFVHFVSHDTLGSLSTEVDDTGRFRIIFSVPRSGKYHLRLKFTEGSRVVGRTQMDICVGVDPDAPDSDSLCPHLNQFTGRHGAAR